MLAVRYWTGIPIRLDNSIGHRYRVNGIFARLVSGMQMSQSLKSVRKLVTLSAELAERVEKFQVESGASSESDALKILIEDGLKIRDRPYDLFQRCENASKSGQRIGEIIERLTADHPLVEATTVSSDGVFVYLKSELDAPPERFYLSRSRRIWAWQQRVSGGYGSDDEWRNLKPTDPDEPSSKTGAAPKPTSPGRRMREELDDDIPF